MNNNATTNTATIDPVISTLTIIDTTARMTSIRFCTGNWG